MSSIHLSRRIGLTALALATTGAVYAGPAFPAALQDTTPLGAAQVGAAQATSSSDQAVHRGQLEVGNTRSLEREVRISRDSSRQALSDATGKELKGPGGAEGKEQNAGIAKLAADAEKAAAEIARNAWQLPIDRGLYRLTSQFGECSSLWAHCHTGLDFAAPSGTPIRAVANGVITETSYAGAYGNRTIMTLEDGTELWYCHQTAFESQPGETVVAGQTIGYVGSTGNSTGPHLHFEVRPGGGDAVDPMQAMAAKGEAP